jgi:hypothetical protein
VQHAREEARQDGGGDLVTEIGEKAGQSDAGDARRKPRWILVPRSVIAFVGSAVRTAEAWHGRLLGVRHIIRQAGTD